MNDILTINYPFNSSSENNTTIEFYQEKPDLINILKPGKNESQKRLFITDGNVASLEIMNDFISCFEDDTCGNDKLLILGSGEPYKNFESIKTIINLALEGNFSRKDCFIAIGGGVVCDITAFAASIFKRGIEVQFVPTTLLCMVDASIGGKTAINIESYKNMIGTFYAASKIYCWPEFIQYISNDQYKSGLAEIFKTAVLFDNELFETLKNDSEKILNRDQNPMNLIIRKCVKAKAEIVEKDFTEQNERRLLNLGHTFAHALETVIGLGAITHGQAVAWGIGRAAELSLKKGYCLENFRNSIFEILQIYEWNTEAIPEQVRGGGFGERILSIMHKDKKNTNDKITLILPKNINDIIIEQTDDKDILSILK